MVATAPSGRQLDVVGLPGSKHVAVSVSGRHLIQEHAAVHQPRMVATVGLMPWCVLIVGGRIVAGLRAPLLITCWFLRDVLRDRR